MVREIVLRLAHDRGEFHRFLAADAGKLGEVEGTCQRLADIPGQQQFPLSPSAKMEMFSETLTIVRDLSAILGRARSKVDREDNERKD